MHTRNTSTRTPVEWFVDDIARELRLGRRPVDQRCRSVLYRLVRWATSEGLPLDREGIFDPATVERFCATALLSDHSRATYRSDLRRMGPQLTKHAPWEPRPAPMATRMVAVPYSPAEIALLRADVLAQTTAHRRRAGRAILALGLGAGLDGRWVGWVRGTDVRRRANLVEVAVGEPAPRTVVVRAQWEDEVVALAAEAGSDTLAGGRSRSKNRITDLTKRFDVPTGHPRLSTARLRSTWLLEHLDAGTRLLELCAAAGIQGFTVLPDLMGFLAPLDAPAADALLRGSL